MRAQARGEVELHYKNVSGIDGIAVARVSALARVVTPPGIVAEHGAPPLNNGVLGPRRRPTEASVQLIAGQRFGPKRLTPV
jgi:hypothetical protein